MKRGGTARRRAFVLGGVLVAVAAGAGCSDPGPSAGSPAGASTLVLDESARRLWLASPDDDEVVAVDLDSLEVVERLDVPGAPEQVARVGELLVVTRTQSASVAVVATSGGTGAVRVRDVPTPCGGTRAVVGAGAAVWISCPSDDLLLELEPSAAAITRSIAAPGRPTALAVSGGRLAATASRQGRLDVRDLDDPARVLDTRSYHHGPGVSASQLDALAASEDGFAAAYQRVDHDSDRARDPALGGYGALIDDRPRIAPQLAADGCAAEYARFNGGLRVASGPSALAYAPATATLWIAHRYTDNVLVFDCAPGGERGAPLADEGASPVLRAAFRVGRGPRGLVVGADGRTAWVDVGFDHAVARLHLADDLDPAALHAPALVRRRTPGAAMRLSIAAAQGRAAFFDATNTHLTPSGVVTCGTCHPDGGEDGLAWFLHTPHVARKLRRTPPAWSAKRALAPYHWDGALPDSGGLAHDAIVELMEGDGLVVDVSAIAAYLEEAPPPFPRPVRDAGRHARGQALFASAGCAECHAGPLFGDGLSHEVLAPSSDPDGVLATTDTPTLLGVRARPPYLHDGRAATLVEVLTTHNAGDAHGRTQALSAADVAALVEYLESL